MALAAEWIKIPDGQGNLQKVWIRDSQARRDIAQIQTDIPTQISNAINAESGLMIPYGYCTTAAATVAKTVTVSPAVSSLETGLTVAVKFQYTNTGSNPTLNVNSLGAVAIKRYGTTAAGTSAAANWNANSVVILIYDGTYWMLVDWNNTTYSGMTDAEYQAGTGTSNRLITPARLKAAIELHAPVQSVNGNTGAVTISVPSKTSDLTNDSGFITASAVPDPSSAAPAMDGTAAAGSSTDYARADHVHPSDTAKQDALTSAQLAAVNSGITANDLAINNASVLCSLTPITITPLVGTNNAPHGGSYYYKIGHRVHLHIALYGLTSATTQTVFKMPAGYRPLTTHGFACLGSSYTSYSRVRISGENETTSGDVNVNPTGTGALIDIEYDAFA